MNHFQKNSSEYEPINEKSEIPTASINAFTKLSSLSEFTVIYLANRNDGLYPKLVEQMTKYIFWNKFKITFCFNYCQDLFEIENLLYPLIKIDVFAQLRHQN